MNRPGARHVGEPVVIGAKGDRVTCLYAAAMVAQHAPGFAAIAHEFEAMFAPPATILLQRPNDPDGATISFMIPSRLIPARYADRPKQTDFEDVDEVAT